MFEVGIYTELGGWQSWPVDGCEAAWDAYRKACDLCKAVGAINAAIWDAVSLEILADLCKGEEE